MLYRLTILFILLAAADAYDGVHRYHPRSIYGPRSFGYSHDPQPKCSSTNQCANYRLILTVDGPFSFSGNATKFRKHHEILGFDRAGMIREGRLATAFLKDKYGVDATNLPDDVYLNPYVQLSLGVTFNFVTVNPTLYMASKRDQVQFYNIPTSVGWWNIDFSEDFTSTGSFKGTIPAGSRVYRGSFVVDTCPQGPSFNKPCLLGSSEKGRVYMRFYTNDYVTGYTPGLFFRINSVLEHDEWGRGRSRGVFIVDLAAGVTTGHEVLSFPDTCSVQGRCYAG